MPRNSDKPKLAWNTINMGTSSADLRKAWEAEQKAMAATDALVRKLAAGHEKTDASHIRVGRNWGRLSYAVDATAAPATSAVSL